ncbi:MAG: c-type cytochrome, partial [Bacteroidaceae bacterium]|nr:c-type cytochrome [Bacteroidaceae bacterium]
VNIPVTAFNTNPKPTNYEVRLESTIGIYGTGQLDAISTEDMKAQYAAEANYAQLNPRMWNTTTQDWAEGAYYTLADGTKAIRKFTYAMTRASLQDGAGANAIWNITNVTRSDRRYLYSTTAWAKAMSEDPEVINYIRQNGKDKSSLVHPYYADTDEKIAEKVFTMLDMNTAAKGGDNYTAAFGEAEMSDKDYYDFMVWHRGLAVPAARNLDDATVQRGKVVFNQIGCASCHRPSWQTKEDNYWVDNSIKAYANTNGLDANKILPKFSYQTIWPYTDMVQHRLFMENDIRTGWCRTTPLWGRGLSLRLTGAEDRLHDCRARNEIEAIMWHAYSKQSDAYSSAKKFYELKKEDRDAVVKFLRSI